MTPHQKTCLVELHYLPCVRYMQLFFQYPGVFIEACENYQKGSYRNRTYLISPQGRQILTVPLLKGKHQHTPITEVRIAYHFPWYAQHWHAIQTGYGSAPFFIHYGEAVRDLLYKRFERLFDLNLAFLSWITTALRCSTPFHLTERYETVPPPGMEDIRNQIRPKSAFENVRYPQVFEDTLGFVGNLSVLDILMHTGPEAQRYLGSSDAQVMQ